MYDFRGKHWDIVGKRPYWFGFSLFLILVGLIAWKVHGFNWGIDFTGGSLYRLKFERPVASTSGGESEETIRIRQLVEGLGIEKAVVQLSGQDEVYIKTQALTQEQSKAESTSIQQALEKQYGDTGGNVEVLGLEQVGPVVGRDLMANAVKAIILGCGLIMIYVWIRYEFRFGVAAIFSLFHDILVLLGLSALAHIEIDSGYVAVALTVVGFSVHDTIIVFDRIRENRKLHRRMSLADLSNYSILQTAARCINTVLTVELTLVALFLLGGATIHHFVLAMLIGVTCGAYSSIFNAACVVVGWDERSFWKPGIPSIARTSRGVITQRVAATASAAPAAVDGPAADFADDETEESAKTEADRTAKKGPKAKRTAGKRKRRF